MRESKSRVRFWIGTLAGIVLALVLLVAAWAKAINPSAFMDQIGAEGLAVSWLPAWLVAGVALGLEAGLGLCLFLNLRRRFVLLASGALILFFLTLTARAWWRAAHGMLDPAAGCGCFGSLVQRTPAEAFWQDSLLLVPAWLLSWLGRPGARRGLGWRYGAAGVGVVAVLLLAWRAPTLPLDDLATRLSPGTRVEAICAGEPESSQYTCLDRIAPELVDARQLVVITGLETPGFTAVIPRLNAWTLGGETPVTVLSAADPNAVQAFFWQWGPAFSIVQAPPALLRPLYRRLPRSFLIVNGVVRETWDGIPPQISRYDEGPIVGTSG